ncbi:MAG TPA: ATP-binding protein [Anaerolineae bacterium]|nr:ATP-binding protein [Anaerolineae bacterium]
MTKLFLICGLPGAGKTTIAKQLENEEAAVRFSPDEWVGAMAADDQKVMRELNELRNEIEALQWKLAQRVLALGTNVILENGFWARAERLDYIETGRRLGAEVILYWCDVPLDELCRRVAERNESLPAGTFNITEEEVVLWSSWFQAPEADELAQYDKWVVVN